VLLYNRTDYRSFIRALVWRLLVDKFDLIFMLAIVRDASDSRPYSFARDARVPCKHGAYHETFEVHSRMVLQVRDVLHRSVYVNMTVTPVSSTVEAVEGMFFVEGVNPLIFLSRCLCSKHEVTNKGHVEELVRNLDRFHVLHVAIHLLRQMHQS